MKTLNTHLRECIKGIPAGAIRVIATLFYTVKYNWFYILLSVLAPLVIYQMGAGREIVALLFEDNGHPYELYLNTLFLILSLLLMSTTIWLIPSLSIYLVATYGKLVGNIPFNRRGVFFQYLINLYSNDNKNLRNEGQNQLPAKYLAMLPWTMVCATLIQFSMNDPQMNTSIIVFLALNSLFLCVMLMIDGILRKKKNFSYWAAVIVVLVLALIYLCVKCLHTDKLMQTVSLLESISTWSIIMIYLAYIAGMIVTFLLLTKGDSFYKKAAIGDEAQVKKCLRKNNRIHTLLFIVTFSSLMLLTYFALHIKLPSVSSLTILLLCLNFYMLIVDSLFTAPLAMSEKLHELLPSKNNVRLLCFKMLTTLLFFGFIWFVLLNNTNNYRHTLPQNAGSENETLESYFDKWRREKLSNMSDTTKTMNVYLISGQGGGSRAAVYILAVLREIEKSRDKELYNQTFSISSISGSSAGIGQYIGQHENKDLQDFLIENNSPKPLEQLKSAYSYNFFNSNLLGLLFYDRIPVCIKDILYKPNSRTYGSFNRNYIQEREELKQLQTFTDSLIPGKEPDYSFFQNNIQDLYNRKEPPYYSTPLVFFNTTVLNLGRKGLFSPLKDTSLFGNNIDLLKEGKPVSFHFAEISSQSFPLLNNFSCLKNYYLGDGGLYENSGTSTTLQIYRHLRQYCNKRGYKVRFITINVLNSSSDAKKNSIDQAEKPADTKSILSLLVDVFSKMPFDGHEADAKRAVKEEIWMNNKYTRDSTEDFVFNIEPQQQFALSRVFSPKTLANFISQSGIDSSLQEYSIKRKYLDSIDNMEPQTVNVKYPNLKSGTAVQPAIDNRIYRVYTQYRNKGDKEAVKAILNNPGIKDMIVNIPPIDLVEKSRYGNEIRYFHEADKEDAARLAALISRITQKQFKVMFVGNSLLSSKTPKGQLELWIDSLK